MKKLKKLELKKQKIVDLSDQDAINIQGGSILDSASVLTQLSDMYCTDYTHTGWSCGGCSVIPGDSVNCTDCDCGTDTCPTEPLVTNCTCA